MVLEALAGGAGIGLGIKAGEGIAKGVKKLFGGSKKKRRRRKKAAAAAAAAQAQENQALRSQLSFATGYALGQNNMANSALAAQRGYPSLVQNFTNNYLNTGSGLIQASTLGATSSMLSAGGQEGLLSASSAIGQSAAYQSPNGRFNAYQMLAYQQAQFM